MNHPIGILDSGIGGLTVLNQIHSLLPQENIIYFGDNKNTPYGNRSQKNIQELSLKIINFLLDNNCKMIVIACNTITIAILEYIQTKIPIPIIGVVDSGVRACITTSANNNIGVLATPYSVHSKAFINKIKAINSHLNIYQVHCDCLVNKLEQGWTEDDLPYLSKCISKFPPVVDTILLGCTHYPLLYKEIQTLCSCSLIDPAYETALETKKYLQQYHLMNDSSQNSKLVFYTSGSAKQFKKMIHRYFQFSYDTIHHCIL